MMAEGREDEALDFLLSALAAVLKKVETVAIKRIRRNRKGRITATSLWFGTLPGALLFQALRLVFTNQF